MSKLERVLLELTSTQSATAQPQGFVPDGRALLLVTLVYLGIMLSVPLSSLAMLVWFAVYPIIGSTIICGSVRLIFKRSLFVLPLILLIGIFNPLLDHTPALRIGSIVISVGWISFISLTLRGLFAVQALLIVITVKGFNGLCNALASFKVPTIFVTQLRMVYRYLTILLQEALDMRRARQARGYGRKTLAIQDWGPFVGQLFLRTVRRSARIHAAMTARGFRGAFPQYESVATSWQWSDTVFCLVWIALFVVLRLVNLSAIF